MIGSLFDGIGGFPLAFLRAGVETAWSAEIDPHCRSVTARHFSQVKQIEDVRDVADGLVRPGIITAGWPCQGNSVAGKRGGMADERSGLWSEVRRILAEFRPRWFLGENVPGLLSVCGCIACRTVNAFLAIHSERNDGERCKCIRCDAGRRLLAAHRGRDFCGILADLAELGYGFAYRIFDAQWFGVAQRRRRVFIVGCLGDWRSSAEVLFESDSLPWHPAPIRESRPRVANCLTSGVASGSGVNRPGRRREDDFNLVTHTLRGEGFDASEDGTGRGTPLIPVGAFIELGESHATYQESDVAMSMRTGGGGGETKATLITCQSDPAIAFDWMAGDGGSDDSFRGKSRKWIERAGDYTGSLGATKRDGVCHRGGVRRLTPRECERLQGFPDDWTRHGADGAEMSDSARYRMLGNSVAVPCVEWIARRLIERDIANGSPHPIAAGEDRKRSTLVPHPPGQGRGHHGVGVLGRRDANG